MATSALVCINLKTRGKTDGVGGDGSGGGDVGGEVVGGVNGSDNTQQLVQALVDNGIIQLNHKATIRVIETTGHQANQTTDIADLKTLSLGTFAVRQSTDTRSGLVLETVGDGGDDQKVVIQQNPSRPTAILVQRNLVLAAAAAAAAVANGNSASGAAAGGSAPKVGTAAAAGPGPGVLQIVRAQPHHHIQAHSNAVINAAGSLPVAVSEAKAPPPASDKPPPQTSSDGDPIKLPDNLESLPKAEHFPTQRHRWNTNEEIAAILICFERHMDWQSKEVKIRPKSGSMLLYSRKKVRYRRDGYCWKKRKDGKTTREDHMKLKVQGTECIYGCYVHSAILPTFHRRCYWLLQNPDIVLVHYLNVPYPDDNKLVSPSLALCADKKQWTKEELVSQLKPMFYSEEEPELNNELEISTAETVETIVSQLLERQRSARASAICKQLECGCPDSTCTDAKSCTQPIRRITAAKSMDPSSSDNNQVSSTTGSGVLVAQRNIIHQQERHLSAHSTNHHNLQQNSSAGGPLVLNLSQIQGSGGLLILNSNQHNQSHSSNITTQRSHRNDKSKHSSTPMEVSLHLPRLDNGSCQLSHRILTQERHSVSLNNHLNNNNVTQSNSNNNNNNNNNRNNNTRMSDTSGVGSGEKLDNRKYEIYASANGNNGTTPAVVVSQKPSHSKHQQSNSTEQEDKTPTFLNNQLKDNNTSTYYETLDLSQEDIQQTLSANMPISCSQTSRDGRIVEEAITNSKEGNGGGCGGTRSGGEGGSDIPGLEIDFIDVNAHHHVDDDVFVNLDAFDMLSEFPELEALDHNQNIDNNVNEAVASTDGGNTEVMDTEKDNNNSPQRMDYREGTANITDFSPDWAYTEGGVKVLVTGPWYSTTSPYTVLFDSVPVPTTLVQSGVLRCYCPAHEVGLVTLQVACEGFVISNSAMFEYKRIPRERTETATSKIGVNSTVGNEISDSLLRYTLMQRLDAVDHNLQIKQEPYDTVEGSSLMGHGNLEEKLVSFVQRLNQSTWKDIELMEACTVEWCETYKNMTLLHLAASLGYSRLVCSLIQWKSENPSPLLDIEIDGLGQDIDGYTPLMWACKKGHSETAILLYEWLPISITVLSKNQQSAVEVARSSGHTTLAYQLQHRVESMTNGKDFLLAHGNIYLGGFSDGDVDGLNCTGGGTELHTESLGHNEDDGLFLRPITITRTGSQNSLELHVNIPSGEGQRIGNMSRRSSPIPCSREIHYRKGVLGDGLVKRPSVDSGIQLSVDSLPSLKPSKHKHTSCETTKLSRFDRSMSLPLNSPVSCLETSGYESSIQQSSVDQAPPPPPLPSLRHSPGRRMDFVLCEVLDRGTRPTTPDSLILLPTEQLQSQQQQPVGEQEVRVLTLAEQIIAAMPDRIKNESEGSDMMILGCDDMEVMPLESPLLLDEPPSSSSSCCFDTNSEFNFDHSYRYYDAGTPCSSVSPPGSCLPSPSFPLPQSPSPPPTTADFCEFLHASNSTYFEKDFSNLTLSDREQRELYEAAKVIQKAYRSYKGRKKLEQDKERQAAILIQNYYRRYKQYAYFKQMTRAAMVIQNGYRSYCENKRFKKNQEAATVRIQSSYRTDTPTTGLKRTYSQRRQHQAARKIQQFMRQSKNKLQKERAEKERQGPCKLSPQN